jgi:hypothetical protein
MFGRRSTAQPCVSSDWEEVAGGNGCPMGCHGNGVAGDFSHEAVGQIMDRKRRLTVSNDSLTA